MTNLVNSQVPNFTTAEQLAAYVGNLLARVNPTKGYLEAENLTIKAAQVSIGKAWDGRELMIIRLSIPMAESWETDPNKPVWQSVAVISDTDVPPAYIRA